MYYDLLARPRRTMKTDVHPTATYKPRDFLKRLKEIDMFFAGRGQPQQSMRRLARNLKKAGVPYAIMGGMAVNAHGAERTTGDVDVLLTPEGLERFQQAFLGKQYDRAEG